MTASDFAPTAHARSGKGPRTSKQRLRRRLRAEQQRRDELQVERRSRSERIRHSGR